MKKKRNSQKKIPSAAPVMPWKKIMFIALISIVLVRILLTFLPSYKIDMGGYKAWSIRLTETGFSKFYNSGTHVVYGPVYLYFLWITGSIVSTFNLLGIPHDFLIKIWAVASDFIGAALICKIGKKHNKEKLGYILGLVYAINPGVFFNSSVWGQFDSIPATMMLGVVYLFEQKKLTPAIILYTLSVITKPQSIFLAPIVIGMFLINFDWEKLSLSIKEKKNDQLKSFLKNFTIKTFFALAGGILTYAIVVLPFTGKNPIYWLVSHYLKSGGDYPYATANGFNLWTILGGQTMLDTEPFLGLTYYKWGFVMLAATVVFSLWYLIKNKNNPFALYYSSYLMLLGSFMLFTRMHERYLFPALIFITVCILWDLRLVVPTALISICRLSNEWYTYYYGNLDKPWISPTNVFSHLIAWLTLIALGYSVYYCFNLKEKEEKAENVCLSKGTL